MSEKKRGYCDFYHCGFKYGNFEDESGYTNTINLHEDQGSVEGSCRRNEDMGVSCLRRALKRVDNIAKKNTEIGRTRNSNVTE